ncbi:uncharacterized protein LOC135947066 [Cloeon dipterum]|uniref:uncharacterized protein LOC135947066 n=1 Tax=Cloeon dipterum TaxID=197152 RepID=UPI0032205FBF
MGVDASKIELPEKKWKRPEQFSKPQIWLEKDGIVVRDITPDLQPFVLEHMGTVYLRDEPMNQSMGTIDDPATVQEQLAIWQATTYRDGISIVALEKGTPGANMDLVSKENPPVIVGVSHLFVSSKGDPVPPGNVSDKIQSDKVLKIFKSFKEINKVANVFESYGVDHYIEGAGLSVSPEWRGKGIGQLLMQARYTLSRAMGIPMTRTIFTAVQSQKVALKGGFEELGHVLYTDLKEEDGQPRFPKMPPHQTKISLMAKRIEYL